jgi:hypothetical protein
MKPRIALFLKAIQGGRKRGVDRKMRESSFYAVALTARGVVGLVKAASATSDADEHEEVLRRIDDS